MEQSNARRMGDPWIAPVGIVIGWCALALFFGSMWFSDLPGRPILDINSDGQSTISDAWLLVKNSWIAATATPFIVVMASIQALTPGLFRLFELETAVQSGWMPVLGGLALWWAAFITAPTPRAACVGNGLSEVSRIYEGGLGKPWMRFDGGIRTAFRRSVRSMSGSFAALAMSH